MNPEIEKLIDLAIADGQITEKERNVILKKASELGIDTDEVEMVLDGRLHQMEASKPKQKEKVGNIKTCPACGASLRAMDVSCSECKHEFQNRKVNKSLSELIDKLEKEDYKDYEWDIDRSKKKAQIIKQFPIPQTKEDIFEFISFSAPLFEKSGFLDSDSEAEAWGSKLKQAIFKANMASLSFAEKQILEEYSKQIELHTKSNRKKARLFWLAYPFIFVGVLFLCYLMFAFIVSLFGKLYWPFK
jgi:hypothetical protein